MARTLETTPRQTQSGTGDNRKWWVLAAMVFGLFMPMLDNLVVNTALPTIQRSLGTGVSGLQWIIDAYVLAFASFMLTGGALGDLYGRKRFFMAGLITFTLGSLLCGISNTTGELVAFRFLQGIGSALLLPGSLSIITATFHGRERGAAIGIWAAFSALALAVGPIVGGYLVEHVSWQSIFYVNIPVGIIGLVLTYIVVRESRDEHPSRRVDPPGLITGTAGLFFLVYALIEGNNRGWTDGMILGSFALAAIVLAAFFTIEARSESPMLPLSFFRIRTFAASNFVAAAVFFALFGTVFFLTLYFQDVHGYSPVGAGARLFPFPVMILLLAPIAGRLSDRLGSRWFMTAGPALSAIGLALVLRSQPDSSYFGVIFPSMVVWGSGMALTMAPMTAAVMASVPTRHAGVASAATNTSRELGGVFGVALLGAIVTSAFRRGFLARLIDQGIPQPFAQQIVARAGSRAAAGGGSLASFRREAPPGTPISVIKNVVDAGHNAFVHAMHVGIYVAIVSMVLAAVAAAVFVRSHVGSHDDAGDGQVAHAG
ncbi:MAG: MFS transporter [Actinobacteria bacterium]|nr:MFS transporter [Actinomycetota bacterium]